MQRRRILDRFHLRVTSCPVSVVTTFLLLVCLTTWAEGQTAKTVSFQDGASPALTYVGTRDTSLSENAPDTTLGTSTTLLIDGDDPGGTGKDLTALIRWDISSIPSGSDVTTATITI